MVIGTPPSLQALNAEATSTVVLVQQGMQAARLWAQKVNKLGTAGLTAPAPGLAASPDDATALLALAGQLANLSGVFYGTDTQAATFDYDDAFTPLYP
jgi:hypothetical protein